MTAAEFARHLLDDSANQVDKVFEGIPEDVADSRVNEHAMSPRETLVHLLDCTQAFFTSLKGETYAWGSFKPEDSSIEGLRKELRASKAAVREAIAGGDDGALKHAADYLIAHEFYHVGQTATFRLTFTPGWDPYSIYPQS